jgi:hypothetical protein
MNAPLDTPATSPPLWEAIANKKVKCASLLIHAGCSVHAPKEAPNPSFLCAAAERGQIELVAMLIDFGANIEDKDDRLLTPLLCAAKAGKTDVTILLSSRGADLNAVNENGDTALAILVDSNYIDTAFCLYSQFKASIIRCSRNRKKTQRCKLLLTLRERQLVKLAKNRKRESSTNKEGKKEDKKSDKGVGNNDGLDMEILRGSGGDDDKSDKPGKSKSKSEKRRAAQNKAKKEKARKRAKAKAHKLEERLEEEKLQEEKLREEKLREEKLLQQIQKDEEDLKKLEQHKQQIQQHNNMKKKSNKKIKSKNSSFGNIIDQKESSSANRKEMEIIVAGSPLSALTTRTTGRVKREEEEWAPVMSRAEKQKAKKRTAGAATLKRAPLEESRFKERNEKLAKKKELLLEKEKQQKEEHLLSIRLAKEKENARIKEIARQQKIKKQEEMAAAKNLHIQHTHSGVSPENQNSTTSMTSTLESSVTPAAVAAALYENESLKLTLSFLDIGGGNDSSTTTNGTTTNTTTASIPTNSGVNSIGGSMNNNYNLNQLAPAQSAAWGSTWTTISTSGNESSWKTPSIRTATVMSSWGNIGSATSTEPWGNNIGATLPSLPLVPTPLPGGIDECGGVAGEKVNNNHKLL